VWGWLLGPFALAHFRVYRDRRAALRFLEPLGRQISSGGLGTLSEIFDGDAPFTPRGCIAQAWTVAEVLRVWQIIAAGNGSAITSQDSTSRRSSFYPRDGAS
jgi:glycogen debranching enzyme